MNSTFYFLLLNFNLFFNYSVSSLHLCINVHTSKKILACIVVRINFKGFSIFEYISYYVIDLKSNMTKYEPIRQKTLQTNEYSL